MTENSEPTEETEILKRVEHAMATIKRLQEEILRIDGAISESDHQLGINDKIIDEWAHTGGGTIIKAGLFILADVYQDVVNGPYSLEQKRVVVSALEELVQRIERHMDEFRAMESKIVKTISD